MVSGSAPPSSNGFGGGEVIGLDRRRGMVEFVEFVCPRCEASIEEEFYGPCASCRTELTARFESAGRVVEVSEYEPKMNVTPNAVALKDD